MRILKELGSSGLSFRDITDSQKAEPAPCRSKRTWLRRASS